jgi:hypothetical protein
VGAIGANDDGAFVGSSVSAFDDHAVRGGSDVGDLLVGEHAGLALFWKRIVEDFGQLVAADNSWGKSVAGS